jgi:4-amino-4-deoxy-L-arabinose transferase-like glycosyltransferase
MLGFLFIFLAGLLISSVGSGLFFVRKFKLTPPETLCAAIGASYVFIYLTSALIYALHLPHFCYLVVSMICGLLTIACWRQWQALWKHPQTRWAISSFGLLFLWTLVLLSMIRNYSGAHWSGDWVEHYERTTFFLDHDPKDTLFFGMYLLPARPPLMNLVAAHFLGQVGQHYDLFQIVCTFLNLTVFFPCWLILRAMVPKGGGKIGRMALLFLLAASPMFIQNATYAWTKELAAFYVILGLWFYLRAWRKNDPVRMTVAFLSLAAGILAHYSAAPYAVFIFLHYVLVVHRGRPGRWQEAAIAGICSAALLGTWVVWSLIMYGPDVTFASNTTIHDSSAMSLAENAKKIGWNCFYSIVPHPFHMDLRRFQHEFAQPNPWGMVRDYVFLCVQTTLVAAMGFLGGLVVLFQLGKTTFKAAGVVRDQRLFWLAFILICTFGTIATHPTLDKFGVAHVCSQPLVYLGITFLAAGFFLLPRWLRYVVICGSMIDFLFGIFLHFSLQHITIQLMDSRGTLIVAPSMDLLNRTAFGNNLMKLSRHYTFWGDHFGNSLIVLQITTAILFEILLYMLLRIALATRTRAGC